MRIADLKRIEMPSQSGCEAYRYTLDLGVLAIRECYARRRADHWTICGPIRRENGSSIHLAIFASDLRDAIAEALDALVSQKGEVAA